MDAIESKLSELGVQLPPVPAAAGAYDHAVRTGNLLYLSGGISISEGKSYYGKLGGEVSLEDGVAAARLCFLNRLSVIRDVLGSLDKVVRIVAINGFVNSEPGFTDQPKVIDGASLLAIELFGERGRHSRTAVGSISLPLGVAVEIAMVVEVGD